MADFTTRPESVNVEQIMDQIRARIREKRGVDYTEQQVQELAAARLKELLERRDISADLLDQFRKLQPSYEPPELPRYEFEDSTLFESHRGPLRFIRKLLQPILKLFFNPNPLIQALNIQTRLNTMYAERESRRDAMRRASDQLYFERLHALVVEMTRASLELKHLRMRIESIGSRLEFNERRTRAVESAVGYKTPPEEDRRRQPRDQRPAPQQPPPSPPPAAVEPAAPAPAVQTAGGRPEQPGEGGGQRRRRRRRRGRRGGGQGAPVAGNQQQAMPQNDADADESESVDVARDDLETASGAESHPAEIHGVHTAAAAEPPAPAAPSAPEPTVEARAPAPPATSTPTDETQ